MKILLTHAYFLNEDEREKQIMKPYPPLGILCISGYLQQNGMEHRVLDTTFSNRHAFFSEIKAYRPNVIGIYCNLMTKTSIVSMMIELRKLNPNIHLVLGGPDVRYNKEDYLKAGADFLIVGEGEESFHELMLALKSGVMEFKEIPGLAFFQNNELIVTNERALKKNIDELPVPARQAIDLNPYLKAWKEHHGKSMLSISTQRGCPYTCKWCSTAVYGQSYRRRSPELVVQEMITLKETYHPDALWFVDDVFTVSHKWLATFRDEVQKQEAIIPFECITRADRLNEEVLLMLKDAGCFRVWIGAESGSQQILDAMDRRVDATVVQEMIQKANVLGIETGTFIMIGYPGETMQDIQATIQHLVKANPDHFTITVTYPIKGTSLYEEVEAKQTRKIDWNTETDRQRDFQRTYSRKFYDYAARMVVNEVNYHRLKSQSSLQATKSLVKSKVLRIMMRMESTLHPQ